MIFASIHNLYQRHNLAYGYPRDLSSRQKTLYTLVSYLTYHFLYVTNNPFFLKDNYSLQKHSSYYTHSTTVSYTHLTLPTNSRV